MSYKMHKPTTRRLYRGQPNFLMTDGLKVVPRAEIEILEQCPWQTRDQIHYAIAKGWLQVVANVRDDELVWEKLTS